MLPEGRQIDERPWCPTLFGGRARRFTSKISSEGKFYVPGGSNFLPFGPNLCERVTGSALGLPVGLEAGAGFVADGKVGLGPANLIVAVGHAVFFKPLSKLLWDALQRTGIQMQR